MSKILVCDDDKEIVEAIDIYLSQEGYEVLKAYDGEEALKVLGKERIDLLVIDVMSQNWTGSEPPLRSGKPTICQSLFSLQNPKTQIRSLALT